MAAPENAQYSVLLAIDPDAPIGALIANFTSQITLGDGRKVLHFWAVAVDPSNHHYLAVDAYDSDTQQVSSYLIPHHLVALVLEPLEPDRVPKIGFV